jgi:RimJ/RimL family protein N-acetyltransferase
MVATLVPDLRTERLLLRPFRMADAAEIGTYADSAEYLRYLAPTHPDAAGFVANNLLADPEREPGWVILFEAHVTGSVFLGLSPEDGLAELACLVAPAYWRLGIATEACEVVIDHAFATLGADKVFARSDARNAGSLRLMERLGLTLEGTLRAHRVTRTGGRADEMVYGLLRHEWLAQVASPA